MSTRTLTVTNPTDQDTDIILGALYPQECRFPIGEIKITIRAEGVEVI